MSDKILTEYVFQVEIQRSGSLDIWHDDRVLYVTALSDLLAREMAIEISNLQISRYRKCTTAEVEEKAPVKLCDVQRIKVSGDFVKVKSLV